MPVYPSISISISWVKAGFNDRLKGAPPKGRCLGDTPTSTYVKAWSSNPGPRAHRTGPELCGRKRRLQIRKGGRRPAEHIKP